MCNFRFQVLDLGLGLGVWSMYAIDRGCQVVAFSPSLDLVQRAVQSMARARDGRGRPMVEALHAFHNRLGCVPKSFHCSFIPVGCE